jgi:ankyrin repeat protein
MSWKWIDVLDENKDWFKAVEQGNIAVVTEMLRCGADVNVGTGTKPALTIATAKRNIDLMKILLDHGACTSSENCIGHSAMTAAVVLSRTWDGLFPVTEPDPRPLQILLAAGGRFGILEAVLLNDVDLARHRLDEGADPDTGEHRYYGTILMNAAELGYREMVNLLVDRGANMEATDDLGQTALIVAAGAGRLEIVTMLIDRGANINAVDWCGGSALARAAIKNRLDVVASLVSRGAKRDIFDAVALSDEALVEAKLREGSDPNKDSLEFGRAAMLAVHRGNVAIVRLLLNHGAVDCEDLDDHSLLAEAARHGHVDVVRLLIERGADLHAIGTDGRTPLAWAIEMGQTAAVDCLRQAGASR